MVTTLADFADVLLPAAGVNPRRETEPGSEVASGLELPPVADAGDERARRDRATPGAEASRLLASELLCQATIRASTDAIQAINASMCSNSSVIAARTSSGKKIAVGCVHPLAKLGKPWNALPRDNAEFRQQPAHRVDGRRSLAKRRPSARGGGSARFADPAS